MLTLLKRFLAAACAAIVVTVGVAPAASAVKRPQAPKIVTVIDWDAPKPTAPGGPTTNAIDWD